MTTPPGWYPDPGQTGSGPALERWWDGSAWTDHLREPQAGGPAGPPRPAGFGPPQPAAPPYGYGQQPAPGGGSRGTKIAVIAVAAVVLVAAIVGGVVLLNADGGGPGEAGPEPSATSELPGPEGDGGTGGDSGGGSDGPGGEGGEEAPPGSGDRAMDAVNGIYLPVPEGWEGRSGTAGAGLTISPYPCPAAKELNCVRGGVNSQAAEDYKATTAEGIAKEDIAANAQDSYGKSPSTGDDAYGGIESHKEIASEAVTVAGEKGYLVRWKLDTAQGDGGIVQSVAFPSPLDADKFVVVRFGFDTSDKAPDVSVMAEITKGIKPLSGTDGGTGGQEV